MIIGNNYLSEQSCLGPEQQQEENSKNNGLSLTNNVNLKDLTINSKNQMPRPKMLTQKNLK
jgi:hypothetical protein